MIKVKRNVNNFAISSFSGKFSLFFGSKKLGFERDID
jgi:hypothetical protein